MSRVIWSPAALRDVDQFYPFLANKNRDAAIRAVKAIRAGMKLLAANPEIGRPAEEMEPEFREWPINFGDSGYVALYRYDDRRTVILAVRHQKEVGY